MAGSSRGLEPAHPFYVAAVEYSVVAAFQRVLRGVVCAPKDEVQVFGLLHEHLTRNRKFDWIDWGTVREQNWQPLISR